MIKEQIIQKQITIISMYTNNNIPKIYEANKTGLKGEIHSASKIL